MTASERLLSLSSLNGLNSASEHFLSMTGSSNGAVKYIYKDPLKSILGDEISKSTIVNVGSTKKNIDVSGKSSVVSGSSAFKTNSIGSSTITIKSI